jgi:hypothetical protein
MISQVYGRRGSGSSLGPCPCILLEEFKVNHENSESAQPVAELPAAVSYTRKATGQSNIPWEVHSDAVQQAPYS